MSILAMYEGGQWHCPARVLTHLDDITTVLAEQGVELMRLATPLATDSAELLNQCAALIVTKGLPGPLVSRMDKRDGVPGYAEVPTQLAAEEVTRSAGKWLLLCAGQARLCVGEAGGVTGRASVLACHVGDLLWLPAGMEWALVPAPSHSCRWLSMASDEAALNDSDPKQSKLSELQLLDI